MSVGSLSASTVSHAYLGPADKTDKTDTAGSAGAASSAGTPGGTDATIADHVAAVDTHEPIRSVSATQGTLVDTYL